MAPNGTRFQLEPYEDVIGGVYYGDGVLRLRPTIGATALDIYGLLVAAVVVALGVTTGSVWAVASGLVVVVYCSRYLRCRVIAREDRIAVWNKRRRFTVQVSDVQGTRLDERERGLGFWPFSGPLTLWPRRFTACSIVKADGSAVRSDALVGLTRDKRLSERTHVETKAAILQRWLDAVTAD